VSNEKGSDEGRARGVLFDVDGTLVDTNYLHVVAWWQAFRSQGHDVAMSDLHRTVGQGSDRFVSSVLGRDDERVRDAHADFYGQWKHQLVAFPRAADLLRTTKKAGLSVVLATSASEAEARHLTAAIGAEDAIDVVTTSADVDASKPDPDIVRTALAKAGLRAEDTVFVGDTVWDVEAAGRAGVACVGVCSGGISATELREAGAVAVYEDVAALLEDFDETVLDRLSARGQ
jgi:HAD superfamily hydrolase (TIGR01509 family)